MNVRLHLRSSRKQGCAYCGSTRTQQHHLGGRHHAAFFTLPLCRVHHERVTRTIQNAAPDLMSYTDDLHERARRARLAALVFLWDLDEFVRETRKQEIQSEVIHENV